jgi:hypothetical protein
VPATPPLEGNLGASDFTGWRLVWRDFRSSPFSRGRLGGSGFAVKFLLFACLILGLWPTFFRFFVLKIQGKKVGHKAFTCYVPHFTLIADTSKPLNAYLEAS